MLSMLSQLTPDRATNYVAQLLELQRVQEPGQQAAAGTRRNGVGGGPWAVRGPGNMAAAQPKAAMHVSGHMPGYNAADPNVKFAPQAPQLSAPLSPLRLHTLQPSLQPRPQEALDHMVTPPPAPPPHRSLAPRPSALGLSPIAHRHHP